MEHLELNLEELKLMETRARFTREHERGLSELLLSGKDPRRSLLAFIKELRRPSRTEASHNKARAGPSESFATQ